MKKIVTGFKPQGGKHCITSSLKQVLSFYGIHYREEMLFGLASGLSFLYLNQSASPMINGRTKVFEFEQRLAKRLHITIKCKANQSTEKVMKITKQLIDMDQPILIYVDMPYLTYLGLDPSAHFGGHAIVLFGYDDERQVYYISDRDAQDHPIPTPKGLLKEDIHLVSYEELNIARSSHHRPFPANNRFCEFDVSTYQPITKEILIEAIQATCNAMLQPETKMMGLAGILKFAKEIKKWKAFPIEKRKTAGITNYFQISADGGTGGGMFRHMYGLFLQETSKILQSDELSELAQQCLQIAMDWDHLADDLWAFSKAGECSLLEIMSIQIMDLYEQETDLFTALNDCIKQYTL